MRRAFIISGSIIAFALTFAGWMLVQQASRPDYTVVSTAMVCRYDSFDPGYQTFIQYKNAKGEVVFESAPAGRCTP